MICSRSLICSPSFFNENLCCEKFRVCVLWNLNKPINPCRSRLMYFWLRCPERPCPRFVFFQCEHQRFLSTVWNEERAYAAARGRQGNSASPSVSYHLFFKKPLVATVHVLDRRDSSHKWRWNFFRKVHFAGADRLDTERSCWWVTCFHHRWVASMLLAEWSALCYHGDMSIRCQWDVNQNPTCSFLPSSTIISAFLPARNWQNRHSSGE